jgi:hypothetical protein
MLHSSHFPWEWLVVPAWGAPDVYASFRVSGGRERRVYYLILLNALAVSGIYT